jgi:hypothetical protein
VSEEKTFFRTSPACGRKFEVHLESRAKLGGDDSVGGTPDGIIDEFDKMKPEDGHATDKPGWPVLKESVPTVVAAEDFRYKYKCTHTGHQWFEVHRKVTQGRAEGYTGD